MIFESVSLSESRNARLDCYVLDPNIGKDRKKTRPAMLIAPGGAYLTLAHKEAEPIAARFLGFGYNVFVLRYSTYIVDATTLAVDDTSHQPAQTIAALKAMAYIRAHADEWDIDTARVYALGFSAGANVVGLMTESCGDQALLEAAGVGARDVAPNGLLLCYPMVSADQLCHHGDAATAASTISRSDAALIRKAVFGTDKPTDEVYKKVDLRCHDLANMPRCFVWQTAEDHTVPPNETTELVGLLQRAGVPVEYHLFQRGRHGMGLADPCGVGSWEEVNAEAAEWVNLALRWLDLDRSDELSHE